MQDIFDRLSKETPSANGKKPDIFDRLKAEQSGPSPTPTPSQKAIPSPSRTIPTMIAKASKAGNSSNWNQFVEKHAQKYNVDPDLIRAVIQQESQGNPKAVSKKGAQGLMQIMPSLQKILKISNPYDPEQNIHGGTAHLADMLRTYKGDIPKALAAYNAGETAVNKAKGIPKIPETQDYVKRIMSNYQASKSAANPVQSMPTSTPTPTVTPTPTPYSSK